LDTVLDAMAAEGYASRTFIVPATGVGARHQRKRVWIVGYSPNNGCDGRGEDARRGWAQGEQKQPQPDLRGESSGSGFDVADSQSFGVEGLRGGGEQVALSHDGQRISLCGSQRPSPTQWAAEPRLDRVADGLPNRVDRIKGLGNAIVPQIAMNIGLAIVEHERKFGALHNC
jgi:DNA (cytosine-5)-methyltransferase 1